MTINNIDNIEVHSEGLRRILRHKFPEALTPINSLSELIFNTGIEPLDTLFPNRGIPYGQMIEITGGVSSGKTSLLFRMLSSLTQGSPTQSDTAAYLDFPRTFFPPAAVAAGVDISRLMVVIPRTIVSGLRTAELLLNHELVRGVVLDLVQQRCPTEVSSTLLHRLRQQTVRARAIVFILTEPESPGHIQRLITPSTVSLRLEVRRIENTRVEISVTKSRISKEGARLEVDLSE